jgi:hypothetical protein
MQKALERSVPHRRHIAELSSEINYDYINKPTHEPIHFGGLKKELIYGSGLVKQSNYQADVIRDFSVKNNMPVPDMSFHPDTLAVGKPIHFVYKEPKNISKTNELVQVQGSMRNDKLNALSDAQAGEEVADEEQSYDLDKLYGGRRIGLPKPRNVGGRRKRSLK